MIAVVYELVRGLLELAASHVGFEGVAIGATAGGLVGLYYVRELASVFVLLARYARVLSVVGAAVLALVVGGSALGVVDIGSVGSVVEQLVS